MNEPSKVCFKCGVRQPLANYYKHPRMGDGHLGKCKVCTKADVRQHRVDNPERISEYERSRCGTPKRAAARLESQRRRRAKNPEKERVRAATTRAIRAGILKRKPCEVCGEANAQAHHEDYTKALEVRWLCFTHHREAHGQKVVAKKKAA